jgi:hypothetical protein
MDYRGMWMILSGDVDDFIGGCGCFCSKAQAYTGYGFEANFLNYFF